MEQNILNTIDLRVLGQELQRARKQRRMKLADAAKIIDVSRTTITAIEKGTRRIKAGELIKLARAYGKQVSDFVRPRPQMAPFPVQFRGPHMGSSAVDAQIMTSVESLQELCRDYLELEQIMGLPHDGVSGSCSIEAFMSRLQNMRLIPTGAKGAKSSGSAEKAGFKRDSGWLQLLPKNYVDLAVNAFEDGLISEGRLMRFLRTDRLAARNIVEAWREHYGQDR